MKRSDSAGCAGGTGLVRTNWTVGPQKSKAGWCLSDDECRGGCSWFTDLDEF